MKEERILNSILRVLNRKLRARRNVKYKTLFTYTATALEGDEGIYEFRILDNFKDAQIRENFLIDLLKEIKSENV